MKLLIFFIVITSTVFAQGVPIEGWIRIDCHGTTTPKQGFPNTIPISINHVLRMHIQINPQGKMPSMIELRDANPESFLYLTKHCTERRQEMTDLTGYIGNWLDWGTDWSFSHLEYGEQFIYNQSCRELGSPCHNSTQCCGAKNICNSQTNTCNRNVIHMPYPNKQSRITQ